MFGPRSPSNIRLWSCAGSVTWTVIAVGKPEQRHLRAAHALFQHHLVAGRPEFFFHHDLPQGGFGLEGIFRNDHALSGGQAGGFDHHRMIEVVEVGEGLVVIAEDGELGGGDPAPLHELLGKNLRAFDLGGGLRRAEHGQTLGAQIVGQPGGQRPFRPDDHQIDFPLERDLHQGVFIVRFHRQVGDLGALARSRAVPAFPGAIYSALSRGDCASFHASACSLPPEPTSKTLMANSSVGRQPMYGWITHSSRRGGRNACGAEFSRFIGCLIFRDVQG